jgi:hypothetical protein
MLLLTGALVVIVSAIDYPQVLTMSFAGAFGGKMIGGGIKEKSRNK